MNESDPNRLRSLLNSASRIDSGKIRTQDGSGRDTTEENLKLYREKAGRKRGRQAADYAACATGFAGCWVQFQGMSSSHRAAGQSAAIFPVTSAM